MTKQTFWLLGIALLVCAGVGVARLSQPHATKIAKGDLPPAVTPATPSREVSHEHLSLPQEEREYIWQLEHHGLVLGKFGFKPFIECLSRRDSEGMAKRLASPFRGEALQLPREIHAETPYAKVVRQQQDADHPLQAVDGPRFIEKLLALTANFRNPKQQGENTNPAILDNRGGSIEVGNAVCGYSFSLISLSPLERYEMEGTWEGTGLIRLWGETGPGQPAEVQILIRYRTIRPTEENLAASGWLQACAITQTQIAQAPRFLFRDVTKERGIDASQFHDNWAQKANITTAGGVFLCDFDRDGIMDMLVTDINRYTLYKGKPDGTFEDVTLAAGLPMTSPFLNATPIKIAAAFIDIDGDGWEDLILGNQVYRNEHGHFKNYTTKTNLRLAPDAAGIIVADYDCDGRLDFYVVRPGKSQSESWLGGKSGDAKGNQLWHNLGNWQFEEISVQAGAQGGERSTFSAIWLDANNDGWPDLYVINEFGKGVLLVNQKNGTFREHLLTDGVGDFGSMGLTCGDIDNDGNIDIYTANMYSKAGTRVIGNMKPGCYSDEVMAKIRSFVFGSQLWHNRGDLKFDAIGKKCQLNSVGWAYGAGLFDLDNDGFLDLYATCGYMSKDRTKPDG